MTSRTSRATGQRPDGTRTTFSPDRRRGWRPARVATALVTLGLCACGGTSGHEDIPMDPPPEDAGSDVTVVDAGLDATIDVTIQYADASRVWGYEDAPVRVLDGSGGEASVPLEDIWPPCGPDQATSPPNDINSLSTPTLQLADGGVDLVEVLSDGGVDPPGAGACALTDLLPDAAYAWTGIPACDECLRGAGQIAGVLIGQYPVFPPCSAMFPRTVDAGANGLGPPAPAGESEWEACAKLWTCMVQNGLSNGTPQDLPANRLFCGTSEYQCQSGTLAQGPCAQDAFDAFELSPSPANTRTISQTQGGASGIGPGQPGYAALGLWAIANVISTTCYDVCTPPDAGSSPPAP